MRRLALGAAAFLLAPALAQAEVARVLDAGDHVMIAVPGARPAGDAVRSRGDRVEIALAGAVDSGTLLVDDDTAKKVVLIAGDQPRLHVHVRHGRRTTALLASATRVETTPEGLVIRIPRKAVARAWKAEAKTQPAAATIAAPPASATDAASATAAAAVPAPTLEAKATASETAHAGPASDVEEGGGFLEETPAALGTAREGGLGTGAIALILCLISGVALVFLRMKKKGTAFLTGGDDGIKIVSTKSLAPKSRLVLLHARGKEMLLSVGEKGARVLGTWDAVEPHDVIHDEIHDELPEPRLPGLSHPRTQSPTVAGILKLRQTGGLVAEDVATDDPDADAEWARELFLATRGGRN